MMRATPLHWRFRLRRLWNVCLDWMYPEDERGCLLCHRPFPQMDEVTRDSDGLERTHTGLSGVCPFCLQDAMDLSNAWDVRSLRLRSLNIPVVTAAPYEGMLRTAIRQWKYDGAVSLTGWFADMVENASHQYAKRYIDKSQLARNRAEELLLGIATGNSGEHRTTGMLANVADMLVPVPTSVDRIKKRGYDQAGILADELSARIGLPVVHVLSRNVDVGGGFTQSQTAKSKMERMRALAGAFRLKDEVSLTGQRVLLLDDVVTTGSTLGACASLLMSAGCKQVRGLAIARVL